MFYKIQLSYLDEFPQKFNFESLSENIPFEDITRGRKGANLFLPIDRNYIPLVRTTTVYLNPIKPFSKLHLDLISEIQKQAKLQLDIEIPILNNALVEVYTNEYRTMGFHSDAALDLQGESYICVFSHYSHPEMACAIRTLEIQHKITKERFSIPMDHNSVIVFSTETNRSHIHKIILGNSSLYKKPRLTQDEKEEEKESGEGREDGTQWLGFTFRTSKSFITFIDSKPYWVGQEPAIELKLA